MAARRASPGCTRWYAGSPPARCRRSPPTAPGPAPPPAPAARLDLVPVDRLGDLIVAAAETPATAGEVWTVAGGAAAPKVSHAVDIIMDALNGWRAAHGHKPLDVPRIITPPRWNRVFLPLPPEPPTDRENPQLHPPSAFPPSPRAAG